MAGFQIKSDYTLGGDQPQAVDKLVAEHHYRSKQRPQVSDEAWAAAPPIAKQVAVSSSLQTIDAYARAASAAGGFDHGNSHLTRTALQLDARGWTDLSRACIRLLAQVDRIEEASAERIERNPDAGDTRTVALVMMLFETARLTAEPPDDPSGETRKRHRVELEPQHD